MKRLFSIFAALAAAATLAACGGKAASDNNTASAAMQNASNTATSAMGDTSGSGTSGAMGGAQVPTINCGAVKPVWVNLTSKAYHEPNDPYYGKTKHGQFMCPSEAKKEGYHPAGGGSMESSGKHHKNS